MRNFKEEARAKYEDIFPRDAYIQGIKDEIKRRDTLLSEIESGTIPGFSKELIDKIKKSLE